MAALTARYANAVRSQMVAGKNPIPRYLRYKRLGRLSYTEQQDLTTEMFAQLQERVIELEKRA